MVKKLLEEDEKVLAEEDERGGGLISLFCVLFGGELFSRFSVSGFFL